MTDPTPPVEPGPREGPATAAAPSDPAWIESAVEAMTTGLVVRDPDGRAVLVNQRALELIGIERDQLHDIARLREVFRPTDADGREIGIEGLPANATLRTGAPVVDAVVGIRRADGGLRWLAVDVLPFRAPGWTSTGALSTFRDATELQMGRLIDRATQAIATRLFEADLGDAGPAVGDALAEVGRVTGAAIVVHLVVDRDAGTARPVAQWRGTATTGAVTGVVEPVPLDQLVWLLGRLARREVAVLPDLAAAPDDAALVASAVRSWGVRSAVALPVVTGPRATGALVLGWAGTGEPDARTTGFASVVARLLGALGERERAHAELRALNARLDDRVRQGHDELARAEERSRALVDALPDLLVELDADGVFVSAHVPDPPGLLQPAEDFVGRGVADVLPDALQPAVVGALERVRQVGVLQVVEYTVPVEGVDHTFECRLVPMSGGAVLGVVRDVTEAARTAELLRSRSAALALANEDLRAAVQARDEFLATVRHELRTPLSAILGMTEILLDGTSDPVTPAQADALLAIEQSGRHLLGLVDDLLALRVDERDDQPLDVAPVDLEALARLEVEAVRPRAEQKDLQVECRGGSVVVDGDERRLRRVLAHLLDNAVKFTAPGGRVGVDVGAEGDEAVVTVWDTGIGIAEGDRARLFQPLVQLDSTTARRYEGVGLGLAVVERLVRAHGGRVTLDSEEGRGSRFSVHLPLPRSADGPTRA